MGEFIELPGAEIFKDLIEEIRDEGGSKCESVPNVPAESVDLPETLPEMPILNRKQILAKLEACKNHLSQVLCHLINISDTYAKTNNPGHDEMTKAIIVALDAAYEMLDGMYKVC